MIEYLYRVVGKDKETGEWVPLAGGFKQHKVRAYDKLGTARAVKSQWTNDPYKDRYYSEFRIERTPMLWEHVE